MSDAWRGVSADQTGRLRRAAAALAERAGISVAEAVARFERLADAPEQVDLAAMVRDLLRIRARRNARLGVDLFRDPAWDMLLDLLVAHHERRPVPISSLCLSSGVPATTALRYVERMVEEGLIVRSGDVEDQRRVLLSIAPDRIEAVEALVREFRPLGPDERDAVPATRAASPTV